MKNHLYFIEIPSCWVYVCFLNAVDILVKALALTLVAHMDWSSGWKSLKQNPSFLDGLSMILHVFNKTVPTQWLLWKTNITHWDTFTSRMIQLTLTCMNIVDYLWTLWIIYEYCGLSWWLTLISKRFLTIVKVWILELSLKKKSIGTSKTFMTCGFTFSTTENYSFLLIIIWKHNEKMWRHLTYFKFQAYNRLLEFSISQSMDKVHYTVQVGNVKSNC